MAVRKPLVLDDNLEVQQLQAGDNIETGSDQLQRVFTAATAIGEVMYADGNGSVDKAQANAEGTSRVVGLAGEAVGAGLTGTLVTNGVLTATTGEWDVVTGEVGGLTVDQQYFLSDAAAGKLLQDDNLAGLGAGDYRVLVGIALSTTELRVGIQERILL